MSYHIIVRIILTDHLRLVGELDTTQEEIAMSSMTGMHQGHTWFELQRYMRAYIVTAEPISFVSRVERPPQSGHR